MTKNTKLFKKPSKLVPVQSLSNFHDLIILETVFFLKNMGITESIVKLTEPEQQEQPTQNSFQYNTQNSNQNPPQTSHPQYNTNFTPISEAQLTKNIEFTSDQIKQPPPPPPDDNNNIAAGVVSIEQKDFTKINSRTVHGSEAAWNDLPEKMMEKSSGGNKFRSPKAGKMRVTSKAPAQFMVPGAQMQN